MHLEIITVEAVSKSDKGGYDVTFKEGVTQHHIHFIASYFEIDGKPASKLMFLHWGAHETPFQKKINANNT